MAEKAAVNYFFQLLIKLNATAQAPISLDKLLNCTVQAPASVKECFKNNDRDSLRTFFKTHPNIFCISSKANVYPCPSSLSTIMEKTAVSFYISRLKELKAFGDNAVSCEQLMQLFCNKTPHNIQQHISSYYGGNVLQFLKNHSEFVVSADLDVCLEETPQESPRKADEKATEQDTIKFFVSLLTKVSSRKVWPISLLKCYLSEATSKVKKHVDDFYKDNMTLFFSKHPEVFQFVGGSKTEICLKQQPVSHSEYVLIPFFKRCFLQNKALNESDALPVEFLSQWLQNGPLMMRKTFTSENLNQQILNFLKRYSKIFTILLNQFVYLASVPEAAAQRYNDQWQKKAIFATQYFCKVLKCICAIESNPICFNYMFHAAACAPASMRKFLTSEFPKLDLMDFFYMYPEFFCSAVPNCIYLKNEKLCFDESFSPSKVAVCYFKSLLQTVRSSCPSASMDLMEVCLENCHPIIKNYCKTTFPLGLMQFFIHYPQTFKISKRKGRVMLVEPKPIQSPSEENDAVVENGSDNQKPETEVHSHGDQQLIPIEERVVTFMKKELVKHESRSLKISQIMYSINQNICPLTGLEILNIMLEHNHLFTFKEDQVYLIESSEDKSCLMLQESCHRDNLKIIEKRPALCSVQESSPECQQVVPSKMHNIREEDEYSNSSDDYGTPSEHSSEETPSNSLFPSRDSEPVSLCGQLGRIKRIGKFSGIISCVVNLKGVAREVSVLFTNTSFVSEIGTVTNSLEDHLRYGDTVEVEAVAETPPSMLYEYVATTVVKIELNTMMSGGIFYKCVVDFVYPYYALLKPVDEAQLKKDFGVNKIRILYSQTEFIQLLPSQRVLTTVRVGYPSSCLWKALSINCKEC